MVWTIRFEPYDMDVLTFQKSVIISFLIPLGRTLLNEVIITPQSIFIGYESLTSILSKPWILRVLSTKTLSRWATELIKIRIHFRRSSSSLKLSSSFVSEIQRIFIQNKLLCYYSPNWYVYTCDIVHSNNMIY